MEITLARGCSDEGEISKTGLVRLPCFFNIILWLLN